MKRHALLKISLMDSKMALAVEVLLNKKKNNNFFSY